MITTFNVLRIYVIRIHIDKTKLVIVFWSMACCVITLVNKWFLNRIGERACRVAT